MNSTSSIPRRHSRIHSKFWKIALKEAELRKKSWHKNAPDRHLLPWPNILACSNHVLVCCIHLDQCQSKVLELQSSAAFQSFSPTRQPNWIFCCSKRAKNPIFRTNPRSLLRCSARSSFPIKSPENRGVSDSRVYDRLLHTKIGLK